MKNVKSLKTLAEYTHICTRGLVKQKTNKKFLLLSVLGIIFVVMGHCGNVNAFFNNIFPFYSFHMALFAFVSGYFFKDRNVFEFLKHKTFKLIFTYIIWNTIYGIIILILKELDLINFGGEFTLYNIFISPFWSNSNQFCFNVAAWFVIAIYFIQLIYFFLNKILNNILKWNTEIIVTIISIVIAVLELNIIRNGNIDSNIRFILTRVVFLMPFYAIGQVYKKIEKYDKLNNIAYFLIILVIQIILLQKFNDLCYNVNILVFRHNYIVYFISSMTGILFWLRISDIFKEFIGNNKIINYIGSNTYTIMMHHIFIFYLFNLLIYIVNTTTGWLGKFDINNFKASIWYFYDSNSNPALMLLYVIIGIAVPLVLKCFIYDKCKFIIDKKIKRKNIKEGEKLYE